MQADTVVQEDLALESLVTETAQPLRPVHVGEPTPLSKLSETYKPASTLAELDHHVHEVFSLGADSTEATDAVFTRLLGPGKTDPSIYYKDVRVFRIGKREETLASEKGDVESRLFGVRK